MVPNRGRHSADGHGGRPVALPLVAFLAVVALAIGGWAVLGRGSDDPANQVAAVEPLTAAGPGTPVAVPRAAERAAALPKLGGLFPEPEGTTTSAAPTTPAAGTTTPAPPRTTTGAPAPPATTAPAPPPPPAGDTAFATEVTRLTNVERGKAGCAAVKTDARLAAAALAHSKDMVDRNYFSHTSPDGKGPGDRAAAAGYPSWSGENIAAGYPTPAAVVQGWMNSPGHKANILNCQSKATGVGYDARQNMWTQMFGFV